MSNNDSSNGFWSALFNVSKDDKIMIWLLRLILLVISIALVISLPIYFYDRANNRETSQLFGLLTFHPGKKDQLNDTSHVPNNQFKLNDPIKKSIVNKQKDTTTKKEESTNYNNGKNINTGVNNGIIGDNGTQNFGIQPRIISEKTEVIQFFLSNYPDKSTHIGFVAPSQEGEIINVKNQIIKILVKKGYTDIENIQGIRMKIDLSLPSDRIFLLNNDKGGVSFYIPSAIQINSPELK